METFLIRALQLIMSLSLLVIIHEAGTSSSPAYLRHEWKNFVYSLTRGSLCSSLNRKTVKQNTVSVGYL